MLTKVAWGRGMNAELKVQNKEGFLRKVTLEVRVPGWTGQARRRVGGEGWRERMAFAEAGQVLFQQRYFYQALSPFCPPVLPHTLLPTLLSLVEMCLLWESPPPAKSQHFEQPQADLRKFFLFIPESFVCANTNNTFRCCTFCVCIKMILLVRQNLNNINSQF